MEELRRQHEHDRENRILQHRAEREERERLAAEAAAAVTIPKPASPPIDPRLTTAVAGAMMA